MTTTYTFDQLKEDVRKEAEALRVHATKEELGRLDISNMRPVSPTCCIYGQMTGNCYCERAADLIKACTTIFIDKIYEAFDNGIEGISQMTISKDAPLFKYERTNRAGMDAKYSAIETYIVLPEARNANLIAYLRGETETLEL